MFVALECKGPRHGSNVNVHQQRNDNKDVLHIYTTEYYSANKKNEIMPFIATWMEVEIAILNVLNQTEKNIHHMILLICGNLKKMIQMNLYTKQK